MTDLRAAFLGDSYVAGAGDGAGLGWVGRVTAAARGEGADLTAYNLGVRRENGPEIAARAAAELAPRFRHGDRYAGVIAFGANDISQGLPVAASVAAAQALVAAVRAAGAQAFLLSPPVFLDEPGRDLAAVEMTQAFGAVAGAHFLDLRQVGIGWRLWWDEAAAGDGAHPNGPGYAQLAAAVGAWPAWRRWLGLT